MNKKPKAPPQKAEKIDQLDLIEFRKRNHLSLVAFGAHTQCAAALKSKFEEKFGIKTLYVYEYFCSDPIRLDVARIKGGTGAAIYAPFLERVLAKREFIAPLNNLLAQIKDQGEARNVPKLVTPLALEPNQEEVLQREWHHEVSFRSKGEERAKRVRHEILISDLSSTVLGNIIFNSWLNRTPPSEKDWSPVRDTFVVPPFSPEIAHTAEHQALLAGYINREMSKGAYLNSVSSDLTAWLAEYLLVVHPWINSGGDNRVGFLAASIASSALFFGHLFVLFPPPPGNRHAVNPQLEPYLLDELVRIINSLYVPSLTLFHNYWAENLLHDFLDHRKDCKESDELKRELVQFMSQKQIFIFSPPEEEGGKDSGLQWRGIERPLQRLWSQRKRLVEPRFHHDGNGNPYTKTEVLDRVRRLRDSLVFRKYVVASPAMIERVQEAMKLHLHRHGKALPCALIVGEAGSGKDQMSHIVKTFSQEWHAFGSAHVLNMATLRPRSVVAPLLLGVDIVSSDSLGHFDGWLAKLAQPSNEGWKSTIIFDELNSLDIENQGALLRVLENAEVMPLGGGPDSQNEIDAMIIAIMNEDPEKITWHPAIEALRDERSIFSGILGELLREYVFRLRRLRDDLYFRLVRGGKIVIPPLRKRIEDIPILFYFYTDEELRRLPEYSTLWLDVEFDAYEYLMDRRFTWAGNIRELQKVAKDALGIALADFDSRATSGETLVISKRHVAAAKNVAGGT